MFSFGTLAGGRDRSCKKRARKPTESQKRLLNSGQFKADKAEEALDQHDHLRDKLVAAMARKRKKRR